MNWHIEHGRGEGADIGMFVTPGSSFRCRRRAVSFALLALATATMGPACDDRPHLSVVDDRARSPAESRLAEELAEPDDRDHREWASRYYLGYIADVVHGDVARARTAYESVIAEAGSDAPEVAARAALRLAELEALAGQRRQAVELMARASILGRNDLAIVERADLLHERLGSLRTAGSDVRGPPIGTTLEGVSEGASEAFAGAEELLTAYHRTRLRPRLEQLRASIRKKENAMYAAVRAYRQVAESPEPLAQIAAEFRVASLHHDLALSLMFDLPPELEATAAARLRKSLESSAIDHLRDAEDAYRQTLAHHQDTGQAQRPVPGAERWIAQATLALRAVEDLLGGEE